MIRLESVTYRYSNSTPILLDYNWVVGHGEAWAVLGPSGSGKTTLLYLLSGLRFPTSGRVLIDGEPLTRPRPSTGLILQDYGLLPWATVRENACLGARLRDFYGPDGKHAPQQYDPPQVEAWLERLGLSEVAERYPSQISGGQRQRTAIARTLSLQPDLLLMDEPFSSLDAPTREDLQRLVLELWAEQNLTMVIVTHSIEEAAVLGRKILVLGNPPNRETVMIENPEAARPDFRESTAYLELTRDLRRRLESA